mgnify:CR=1 FL=1
MNKYLGTRYFDRFVYRYQRSRQLDISWILKRDSSWLSIIWYHSTILGRPSSDRIRIVKVRLISGLFLTQKIFILQKKNLVKNSRKNQKKISLKYFYIIQYSCPNWYNLVRKKTYQLEIISDLFPHCFKKRYQLGHAYYIIFLCNWIM